MGIFDKSNKSDFQTAATIIAPDSKISGEINLSAHLHVEGELKGTITTSSSITIGKNGFVEGDIISTDRVSIRGKFCGQIQANVVEILESGELMGNVESPNLIIEYGGTFIGSSKISNQDNFMPKEDA